MDFCRDDFILIFSMLTSFGGRYILAHLYASTSEFEGFAHEDMREHGQPVQ